MQMTPPTTILSGVFVTIPRRKTVLLIFQNGICLFASFFLYGEFDNGVNTSD